MPIFKLLGYKIKIFNTGNYRNYCNEKYNADFFSNNNKIKVKKNIFIIQYLT